jgi:CRP/FNR family transcriptional regulator
MATALLSKQASIPQRFPGAAKTAAMRAVSAPAAALDRLGSSVTYPRGKTVIEEGNPADFVYKVVSGALRKVRLLPDGRRHITSFLMPGDFFGFAEGPDYTHTVEAVADVTLVRYARRGFDEVLENDPRAGHHFLGLICRTLSATQDQLLLLGRKSALERLASFLLAIADRTEAERKRADQKAAGRPGAELDLPMNRADVADYLGLTIETVSRLITRLRSLRLIDTPDAHRVVILDRNGLHGISAGEAGE